MATRLTAVWKTKDGKFFETEDEANTYEQAEAMIRAIRQAQANASHDTFGRTSSASYERRLAEELVAAGFRFFNR